MYPEVHTLARKLTRARAKHPLDPVLLQCQDRTLQGELGEGAGRQCYPHALKLCHKEVLQQKKGVNRKYYVERLPGTESEVMSARIEPKCYQI